MVQSVCGCRLPRVARDASSDSQYSGSAAARSPLACNSTPRLLMELSVLGCRLPRVSRRRSSASRSSGSAPARSPFSSSSVPRLLTDRLAQQRLGGCKVALSPQQQAEVADGAERSWMPTAEGLAQSLQRLAIQRLSLGKLALHLQLRGELVQGEDCVLTIRALDLEPCTQKLEAQRIAVLVLALAAAVGCVLPLARAPPSVDASFVGQLGGAAARTRLHERAVVLTPEAHTAPSLLRCHSDSWAAFRPRLKFAA
eukprot:scaffold75141_cov36-Phaeocystis_antarctica.AAC.1